MKFYTRKHVRNSLFRTNWRENCDTASCTNNPWYLQLDDIRYYPYDDGTFSVNASGNFVRLLGSDGMFYFTDQINV